MTGGRGKGAQMLIAARSGQLQQKEGWRAAVQTDLACIVVKGVKLVPSFCKLIGNCEENVFVQKLVPLGEGEDKSLFSLERGNTLRRVKYCDVDTRGFQVNEEFGDRLRIVAKKRASKGSSPKCVGDGMKQMTARTAMKRWRAWLA